MNKLYRHTVTIEVVTLTPLEEEPLSKAIKTMLGPWCETVTPKLMNVPDPT